MLEPLGLDDVCESIYIAILQQPGVRAESLAKQFEFSRSEIDRALQQLKKLTLLQRRGKDEELYAISPERGMEILLAVQQADSRGRDRHCWRPPAQIPASGITALGSCHGYLAANRAWGQGCLILVVGR